MSDKPWVIVIAPSYVDANRWGREHEVPRRLMKVVMTVEHLERCTGDVRMSWPPSSPDPGGVKEHMKKLIEKGQITLVHC